MQESYSRTRVLIADDSALMRKTISEILESSGSAEIVGVARNGEEVIFKARDLHPDVITMDINMPVIDGITALKRIVKENICPVIIISYLTSDSAQTTLEALEMGAFDYIEKPGGLISRNFQSIKEDVVEKVKAAVKYKNDLTIRKKTTSTAEPIANIKAKIKGTANNFKAVALGISTGGPRTIHQVIPVLPKNLNAAFFLVQHMPPHFTKAFAENLNRTSLLSVVESESGMFVESGTVYVAKGGYQLSLFKKSNGQIITRLSTKPVHKFKPSVDITMKSVLKVFGKDTIGVLMTGMGSDGADAMVEIKERGGYTIAESEETAIVFGMPKEAINRGGATIVLPSNKIANEIVKAISM